MDIAKKLAELPESVRNAVLSEMKKYNIFSLDVSTMDSEQLSKTIALINKEEVALNNKLIQLETQIQEKEKQLSEAEEKLKKMYGVSSISELKSKKMKFEKELNDTLSELRSLM